MRSAPDGWAVVAVTNTEAGEFVVRLRSSGLLELEPADAMNLAASLSWAAVEVERAEFLLGVDDPLLRRERSVCACRSFVSHPPGTAGV